jgi:hypothetical protein
MTGADRWFVERLFSLPEFALPNKDILPFDPNQDIRLALKIERLACRLAFVNAVKLYQEMPTQLLLWQESPDGLCLDGKIFATAFAGATPIPLDYGTK